MKRGRSTWVLGGGAVLLVLVLAVPAPRRDEATPGAGATAAAGQGGGVAFTAVTTPEQLQAQRDRTQSTEWGRDPFTRVAATSSAPPVDVAAEFRPRLEGISRAGDSWMALIDGQLVQRGARLTTGQTVVEITRGAVTLSSDGSEMTLELGETR